MIYLSILAKTPRARIAISSVLEVWTHRSLQEMNYNSFTSWLKWCKKSQRLRNARLALLTKTREHTSCEKPKEIPFTKQVSSVLVETTPASLGTQ